MLFANVSKRSHPGAPAANAHLLIGFPQLLATWLKSRVFPRHSTALPGSFYNCCLQVQRTFMSFSIQFSPGQRREQGNVADFSRWIFATHVLVSIQEMSAKTL
jgi:hypothetical protein